MKIAYFSYPFSFGAPAPYLPFGISRWSSASENQSHRATPWWKLHDANFKRLWLIHPCERQTDGLTTMAL